MLSKNIAIVGACGQGRTLGTPKAKLIICDEIDSYVEDRVKVMNMIYSRTLTPDGIIAVAPSAETVVMMAGSERRYNFKTIKDSSCFFKSVVNVNYQTGLSIPEACEKVYNAMKFENKGRGIGDTQALKKLGIHFDGEPTNREQRRKTKRSGGHAK